MSPFWSALLGYMLFVLIVLLALLRLRPRPARPQPKDATGVLSTDDELYDAFRRRDQYGLLGAQPQPLLEYLRLAVLLTTLAPLKLLCTFSCVFAVHLMCRCASAPLGCAMHTSCSAPCVPIAKFTFRKCHHNACYCRVVSFTLPKEMQARIIAIIGRFLCWVCLFGLGFTSVEWSIDQQGQLPEGIEPGAS